MFFDGGEKWNIYKADWIHFIVFVTNEIFAKPHQRRQINEDGSWIWRRQWMSLWKNNTYGVKGKKLLLVTVTVQFELLLHKNFNCCDSIGFQVRGESRLFFKWGWTNTCVAQILWYRSISSLVIFQIFIIHTYDYPIYLSEIYWHIVLPWLWLQILLNLTKKETIGGW